ALVVLRDFDLFAVFEYLFQIVIVASKLRQFCVKLFFKLYADLVRSLTDDYDRFIKIACWLVQFSQISRNSAIWNVAVFCLTHIYLDIFIFKLLKTYFVSASAAFASSAIPNSLFRSSISLLYCSMRRMAATIFLSALFFRSSASDLNLELGKCSIK